MYSSELKEKMYRYLFKKGNKQTLNKINEDKDEVKYFNFNKTKREVERATNFLPEDIDFNARIYCIENDTEEYPICKVCGEKVKWSKTHKKFPIYCSKSCLNKDPEIRQKMDKSKKKNGTYSQSQSEEIAYKYLQEEFGKVYRQYKDKIRYPFNCDFYLPHLDLFIEINVNWTHGGEPFDSTNPSHQALLKQWKNRKSDFFEKAVEVWTEHDVSKFYYAEINNLNFIAIYDWNDKEDFIRQISDYLKYGSLNKSLNVGYTLEDIEKEIDIINNKKGDVQSSPQYNKAVLTFQPLFYKKEKNLLKDSSIREKLYKNRKYYLSKNRDDITDRELLSGFKKSGIYYGYSHFSPLWIKYFIEKYNIGSIYDPCGGWGHRLLGAWNIEYIYNDANENVKRAVQNIWKTFGKNNEAVKTFSSRDAAKHTPHKRYDAVFTCPPYFNKEDYDFKKDSIKLYPYYVDWLNIWWYKVIEKSLVNCKKYFAFVINLSLKEDMKSICNKFNLELVEEIKVGSENKKSHFQKVKKSQEWLVVYKRKEFLSDEPETIQCKICNKKMKSIKGLKKHLSMRHPEADRKDYYNKYLKPESESIKCPYCSREKAFYDKGMYYRETCGSSECISKINSEKVKKHHNNITKEEWSTIIEKRKETNRGKYGVDFPSQSKDILNKRRSNYYEKYGVINNSQTKEWKEKVKGQKRIYKKKE